MDRLEKYIKENRDSLDLYDPSPEVWEKIRRKSGKGNRSIFLMRAAAALILLLIGAAGLLYFASSGTRSNYSGHNAGNQVLVETEIYYNSLLESLFNKAEPMLAGQPEIEEELRIDMAQLDSICLQIKKDLNDNVANQEVIEALIQNYTIKIRLLEEMLNMLNEKENNTENGKSNEL